MKPASSGLLAYLNAARASPDAPMIMADAFLFTLANGNVLAYTNIDVTFTYNGVQYLANSVRVDGLKYKSSVGLSVDQQQISIAALSTDTITGGASFLQALRNGAFDGCEIVRYRVFFNALSAGLRVVTSIYYGWIAVAASTFLDYGSVTDAVSTFLDYGSVADAVSTFLDYGPVAVAAPPQTRYSTVLPTELVGGVMLFKGRLGTIDEIGRTSAKLTVNSDLVLLDIDMPRNLYQPTCLHTLYDAGCTMVKASFGTNGTVGSGSSASTINWSGSSANFQQGSITFTSGANSGVTATILSAVPGVSMQLSYPLQSVPIVGDAFTVYFGCDRTQATCKAKFNNLANFRGFPYVPPPQMAI